MSPWMTVGMHAPSYSSDALCVQRMEESPRIQPTDSAQMTCHTTWYSSAPLRSPRCPSRGCWGDQAVRPSPTPYLYVAPAENMVGRVPVIPCFLAGNSTPEHKDSGFPFGCANTAAADGRRGSNVYEVNPWLWQFGRGKPRLGGLTVEGTTERKKAAREGNLGKFKRGWETRRRRKAYKA
jgi:hypothetical protein